MFCLVQLNKVFVAMSMGVVLSLAGCTNNPTTQGGVANADKSREVRIAELHIVDCLLPGQVRMLGSRTYMTPRRPATLTAAECQIRGGEYVAYDRADYKTALNIWMPTAQQGDAAAQVNVGEIFEKGAGGTPNYEAAIIWYAKAAEQGNKRAQFNLGTLYEQGLGVDKDPMLALSWYRKAWGLPEDNLVFQSAVDQQQKKLLVGINKDIRKKDLQISMMSKQLVELNKAAKKQTDTVLLDELQALTSLVSELQAENKKAKQKKLVIEKRNDGLKYRTPTTFADITTVESKGEDVTVADINFGKYYALVIGVQSYDKINNLDTPINDINRVADVLSKQYGFHVQKVINADDVGVMEAINNINAQLTGNDNLLIYYAGHGARLPTAGFESGYWLPTNAEAPPRDTYWVANEFVTRHLSRFKAKRVLVVSDSCYSGLLSNAPGFLIMGEEGKYTDDYIKYKASKRSRLLLASGGDKPVLDGAGGKYSIFSQAFIEALNDNEGIMSGPQLFMKVKNKVAAAAQQVNFDQTPKYKTIKGAGHEVGDFFFIPQRVDLPKT